MARLIFWIAAGGLAATLTACPTRTPPPPPTPTPTAPPIQVPPGCEAGQAGEYHHADNPAFLYRGEDDGGTLTLSVTRVHEAANGGVDGGSSGGSDGGSTVSIVLRRTPQGFVGETRATVFTQAGAPCAVGFPTQATACDPKGLSLRSVASAAIDENCLPATSGPKPLWKEQRLLRGPPDAGTGDAGAADAGNPDAGTADAGSADAGSPDAGAPRR